MNLNSSIEPFNCLIFDFLPEIKKELNCELYQWKYQKEMATFSQFEAFIIHNHLILDTFSPHNVYIISNNLEILKVNLVEDSSTLLEPVVVYTGTILPFSSTRRTSPILFFLSTNIACFYDGLKLLHIIRTFNREDFTESWKCLCSADVNTNENSHYTLLECRIELKDVADNDANLPLSGGILHCCFLRIYDGKLYDKDVELIWNTYYFNDNSNELTILNTKTLRGSSPPQMVTFSEDFKNLEIIGDPSFRYISSDLTAHQLSKDNIKTMASWWQEENDFIYFHYYVKMSPEEFTVDILYPDDIDQELVILFHVKDKEPLELYKQKMSSIIDKTLSKWYLENEMLIIELKKVGSTELEDDLTKNLKVTFNQFADFDIKYCRKKEHISFNALSGSCTEKSEKSKNEFFFNIRRKGSAPNSCTEKIGISKNKCLCGFGNNDPGVPCLMDGLVWNKGDSGSQWVHRRTLDDFEIKTVMDRRSITSSLPESGENDIKFVVTCDWNNSIWLFKQMNNDLSVKNTNSEKVVTNAADELILIFERCFEIVGMVANKKSIFVLYRTFDDTINVSVVTCK